MGRPADARASFIAKRDGLSVIYIVTGHQLPKGGLDLRP